MGKILKIILAIVVGLVLLALLGGSPEEQTTATTQTKTTTTAGQPAAQVAVKQYGIGERAVVGDTAYTVKTVRTASSLGSSDFGAKADGVFLVVELEAENLGKESAVLYSFNVQAVDSQGRKFASDSEADIHLGNSIFLKQIQPGLPTTGRIAFDVPMGETFTVELTSGFWDTANTVSIAVGNT
ncbi:Telomeric repeat-binding factor 2 [Methanomethylovorans hollandica DSM 15978]|uniref:Telomeric repeat-binding factor 2 n=1 Tax=Methanomethylovorans hollandica (strain DSM 15978 / NBRC 107637 / DMS1) TaxID=867904 RepID=L0KZA3_METHD|nr:DUF4352 domain-containing protein [Methanomethylovorans hollandica]AGB49418.1 Telomeric repeat-binding factor 2 [Methanomethylovorans hollandica DSM 15978]